MPCDPITSKLTLRDAVRQSLAFTAKEEATTACKYWLEFEWIVARPRCPE
jgi:hypothetical protein